MTAALTKLSKYYLKLEDSPAYFAATSLHPYYKYYFVNSWGDDNPGWLAKGRAQFQQLWAEYNSKDGTRTDNSPPRKRAKVSNIDAYTEELTKPKRLDGPPVEINSTDEFERWFHHEPNVQIDHVHAQDPIGYWVSLKGDYPHLSKLAIDVLSIPASSCYCERMFSETGDMMEPKRRKLNPQLLSAIQCVRSWGKAGFVNLAEVDEGSDLSEKVLDETYNLTNWEL